MMEVTLGGVVNGFVNAKIISFERQALIPALHIELPLKYIFTQSYFLMVYQPTKYIRSLINCT